MKKNTTLWNMALIFSWLSWKCNVFGIFVQLFKAHFLNCELDLSSNLLNSLFQDGNTFDQIVAWRMWLCRNHLTSKKVWNYNLDFHSQFATAVKAKSIQRFRYQPVQWFWHELAKFNSGLILLIPKPKTLNYIVPILEGEPNFLRFTE